MKRILLIMISIASLAAAVSCGTRKDDAATMASKLLKDKGITVPFHPSTDYVELMRQYKANPELWDSAFECLSKTAPVLSGVTEFGTTELVGKKCYAVFSEYIPKPFEETKLEGHHDYIDIQLTEGPVKWGVCPSDSPKLKVLSEYDPSIEAGFYLSDDTVYYTQEADQPFIFVFFPKNLHNPSFAADGAVYDRPLKKLVIKVANAE